MDNPTMAERMTEEEASLLPYLDSRKTGLRLKLTAIPVATGPQPSAPSLIEASGPLAAILPATISAEADRNFRELFLLVQPDRYPDLSSELRPVSNLQVETRWQDAFASLSRRLGGEFPLVLPGQTDAQGRLLPLRPLFYCRHQARFCHPLCPHCGGALSLCRDDQTLRDAGLSGYSDSLARYLFCPACHGRSAQQAFYTYTAVPEAPAHLYDGGYLIEAFSRLLGREDLADDLPCVGCPEATACYGPQTLVRERMAALFFYPFYMLLQPAPSLNAIDFLALLAGASVTQVGQELIRRHKPGRLGKVRQVQRRLESSSGLLFGSDPRRFLEVLYLKLTFLGDLVGVIARTGGPSAEPVAGMSLESLWVHLPEHTTRLPLFWNYVLRLIDAVGRPEKESIPGPLPSARTRFFLGTAWCYVLLVNARQEMAVVQAAVDKVLADPDGLMRLENTPAAQIDPALASGNLLWTGDPLALDAHWETLWGRALAQGIGLLQAGRSADPAGSEENFNIRLEQLRTELHALLFSAPASASVSSPAIAAATGEVAGKEVEAKAGAGDAPIAQILHKILAQWPRGAAESHKEAVAPSLTPQGKGPPATHPDADGDFVETVILGAEKPAAEPKPAAPERTPELEKTVLIGSPQTKPGAPAHPEDMQATRLIPSARRGRVAPPIPADMEETVLISSPGSKAPAQDDLEKTVLMTPQAQAGRPPKAPAAIPGPTPPAKAPRPAAPEDLAETVILSPDAAKGRRPKP
jgi:hypothetical protein